MKRVNMQNENSIAKRLSVPKIDLDTKKEIAKIGMATSLGLVTVTSFFMHNKFSKNLHIGAGFALIGFCVWHHLLYQPSAKVQKEAPKRGKEKPFAHPLQSIYTELVLKEKFTQKALRSFLDTLSTLHKESGALALNLLIDVQLLQESQPWETLVSALKEESWMGKIALFGTNHQEESVLAKDVRYFTDYQEAKQWAS